MVWIRHFSLAAALGLLLYVPTPHRFGSAGSACLAALYFGLLLLASVNRPPLVLPADCTRRERLVCAPGARKRPEGHVSDACGTPRERGLFGTLLAPAAAALAAFCLVLQLQAIFHLPIDSSYADMLPLVRSALEAFWSGEPAYRVHSMPWPLPLTFPPLLWLSYLPAWLAGVDLRLLGLAGTLVLLTRIAGTTTREGGVAGALVLLALATSSKFTEFARVGHLPLYWMVLFLFAQDLAAGRRRGFVWLGLLLGTRQTAWLLLPPLTFAALRESGRLRDRLVPLATAVLVGVGVSLPFILQSPGGFVDGTLRWYAELGGRLYGWNRDLITGQIGLGGLFYDAGAATALSWVRLCGLVACWSGPLWGRRGPTRSVDALTQGTSSPTESVRASWTWRVGGLISGALGIAVFSLFSAPSWWYSLLDPVLLLLPAQMGLAAAPRERVWRRFSLATAIVCMEGWIVVNQPHVEALRFDASDAPRLLQGFGQPERWGNRSFAWALAPRALLAVPHLRPFQGELLISLRPAERFAAELEIQLNGRVLARSQPERGWQTLRIDVPPGLVVLGNNSLSISGKAPPHSADDPRTLLAAIDEVVLARRPAAP